MLPRTLLDMIEIYPFPQLEEGVEFFKHDGAPPIAAVSFFMHWTRGSQVSVLDGDTPFLGRRVPLNFMILMSLANSAMGRAQVNREGLDLNGAHQFRVCGYVNLLSRNNQLYKEKYKFCLTTV
jgi:hypothetical protein